jgi:hypothetical protein
MRSAKRVIGSGALGLLALWSVPAAAQYGGSPQSPPPEEARRSPRRAAPAPAAETPAATPAEVLAAVACALGRDARVGDALLAAVPRSPEEMTAARAFLRVAERCVRNTSGIATSAMTLRGAIAETLYETQFATAPAARTPPLGAKPLARPAPSADAVVAELAPSYDLVDCTVPKRPDLVRALLATEPRTEAEIAAINALNPAFATCLARNARISIEPRSIRSMFAEALHHWALVQRDGPASPWAAAPPAPAAAPGAPAR